MNRGTYTAANGMIAQQHRLDVLANNLANVNTTGFKADRATFGDMMVRTMARDGGYGRAVAVLSSGPDANTDLPNATDLSPGAMEATGNPLDMALGGKTVAMFAVRGDDGTVRYTRDGAFSLNDRGDLVTANGEAVLDPQGKPLTGVVRAADGGLLANGRPLEVGTFVGGFAKDAGGKGLYDGTNVRAALPEDGVRVRTGALEASNVNPVLAMVDMIALQRSYEISQKMIQNQDDSTAKLAETIG